MAALVLAWSRSQAVEHNVKQVVPRVEGEILNERPQVRRCSKQVWREGNWTRNAR